MGDTSDDLQTYALAVLAGVVALVLGGVIALAAATSLPAPPEVAAATPAIEPGAQRIYFELDADTLPADAADVLAHVADAARANLNTMVLISGFHDRMGAAEHNAYLARRRAEAVRHALIANGVAPQQLVLDKPRETSGGDDARAARRVELHVR